MVLAFTPMGPGQPPAHRMCFSATASFTTSALLVAAGGVSLHVGRRPGQWAFASIPLIFAAQQLIEGFLWLRLVEDAGPDQVVPLARAFLVFALVLWPLWVPLSVLLLEKDQRRRRWLRGTLVMGAICAAYLAWSVFAEAPQASIDHHHIHYTVHYPWHLEHPSSVPYFVATVLAVFLSSMPRMWILAAALLVSYAVARLAFMGNVISVWCYFAALISIVIIHLLHRTRKAFRAELAGLQARVPIPAEGS